MAHHCNCITRVMCYSTGTLTDAQRRELVGYIHPDTRGVFYRGGHMVGMVHSDVRPEYFECCPQHPNTETCPGNGGCRHCNPDRPLGGQAC